MDEIGENLKRAAIKTSLEVIEELLILSGELTADFEYEVLLNTAKYSFSHL